MGITISHFVGIAFGIAQLGIGFTCICCGYYLIRCAKQTKEEDRIYLINWFKELFNSNSSES